MFEHTMLPYIGFVGLSHWMAFRQRGFSQPCYPRSFWRGAQDLSLSHLCLQSRWLPMERSPTSVVMVASCILYMFGSCYSLPLFSGEGYTPGTEALNKLKESWSTACHKSLAAWCMFRHLKIVLTGDNRFCTVICKADINFSTETLIICYRFI